VADTEAPPEDSEVEAAEPESERPVPRAERWKRWAPIAAFGAVEAYAFAFWLRAGRHEWFYLDEWDFLARRRASEIGDLLRPHNEHWVTIPILIYRSLFWAFGLRDYLPYRLVIIVLYLGVAALLYVVIRRAGANAWIAAAAASAYALFGAGWENAIKPFQMTFTGAVFFGLVFLVLADHDGPFDRRDRFALLAGLAALMMSGIAVTMIGIVGLAVLLRRGWRMALMHVGPLATIFVVWWIAFGHGGHVRALGHQPPSTLRTDTRFLLRGFERGFQDLGHLHGLGWVLLALLVIGAPLAWRQRRHLPEFAELAAPVALLAGAFGFLVTTAVNRSSFGPDYAGTSRYVSLTVAMLLPPVAVAADALARRWRVVVPITMALLLVGIPSGLHHVTKGQHTLIGQYSRTRYTMLWLPRDPHAGSAPRSLRPEQLTSRAVTIGWLVDGLREHRIPKPPALFLVDPLASSYFRLSFFQNDGPAATTSCTVVRGPMTMNVRRGEVIGVYDNPVYLVPATRPYLVGYGLLFVPSEGKAVSVIRRVGRVIQISPYGRLHPPKVCVGKGMPRPKARDLPPKG
jgi:hypothetical protein